MLLLLAAVVVVYLIGAGYLGSPESAGAIQGDAIAPAQVTKRLSRQRAVLPAKAAPRQILFGDLHVHTTFSFDAYTMGLPVSGGDVGSHPPADACDYARYCSALDFWSINDHAEQITPQLWRETVDSIRQCNKLAENTDSPDLVSFIGWEWTQSGPTPEAHFGHKNVVLRDTDESGIAQRPIAAPGQGMPIPPAMARGVMALAAGDQRSLNLNAYLKALEDTPVCVDPANESACREIAEDPQKLFSRLDSLGVASMVIPHGTTWGIYSPPGTDWRKQLQNYHDPKRQSLVEVYSGHGNSERWIDNQAYTMDDEGRRHCPEETPSYLPGCQQAGRIITSRCLAEGLAPDVCEQRAMEARQNYVDAGMAGHMTVPGVDMWSEWRDSGQCRDCFLPAFNYRRRGSAQYMLAMTDFSDPQNPRRLDFGFIASSDNHTARPGTGYKQFGLSINTEARQLIRLISGLARSNDEPVAQSTALRWDEVAAVSLTEPERFNSFWYTGGLVAVHADSRDRNSIWDALQRKEVYGTSGPRILLWFDHIGSGLEGQVHPMGSQLTSLGVPRFRVRAVGSLEQKPGCPDYANNALGSDRLQRLCQGECYYPSEQRRAIERIEIIRIRPQNFEGEPIDSLIEDPWRVHQCDGLDEVCEYTFDDPEFEDSARDAIYYSRVIEAPTATVNGANLGCEYDERGVCVRMRDCGNGENPSDDCLSPVRHRAWSSPIFVDYGLAVAQ